MSDINWLIGNYLGRKDYLNFRRISTKHMFESKNKPGFKSIGHFAKMDEFDENGDLKLIKHVEIKQFVGIKGFTRAGTNNHIRSLRVLDINDNIEHDLSQTQLISLSCWRICGKLPSTLEELECADIYQDISNTKITNLDCDRIHGKLPESIKYLR